MNIRFNANPNSFSATPNSALAQSGSLTGQGYTPVARVVTLVEPYGNVNSSTALFNAFDTNNPHSAYTADGVSSVYVSGQGSGRDATGGVFLGPLGAVNNAPVAKELSVETASVFNDRRRDARLRRGADCNESPGDLIRDRDRNQLEQGNDRQRILQRVDS